MENAQERFKSYFEVFDRGADRAGTHSIKWDSGYENHRDAIPMGTADTDFETVDAVKQAIVNRAMHVAIISISTAGRRINPRTLRRSSGSRSYIHRKSAAVISTHPNIIPITPNSCITCGSIITISLFAAHSIKRTLREPCANLAKLQELENSFYAIIAVDCADYRRRMLTLSYFVLIKSTNESAGIDKSVTSPDLLSEMLRMLTIRIYPWRVKEFC